MPNVFVRFAGFEGEYYVYLTDKCVKWAERGDAKMVVGLLSQAPGAKIVECFNRISCSHEEDNIYLFDYRGEISEAIGDALGIDFKKKRMRLSEIKNIIADTKR